MSLFSYAAAGIALFFMQGQLIYMPDDRQLADCNLPIGTTFWHQDNERGILADAGHDRLLIFFHGNADMACDWRYLGKNHLNTMGYDVLVMEYPGYGGDDRTPSKLLIEAMIDISHNWVSQQDYLGITVMGFSLGTGAASLYPERYGAEDNVIPPAIPPL